MKFNKGGDTMSIQTKYGILKVQLGYDIKDYPEYYIVLDKGKGVEFTLAVIGESGDCLRTAICRELGDEDLVRAVEYDEEDVDRAYWEMINDCM